MDAMTVRGWRPPENLVGVVEVGVEFEFGAERELEGRVELRRNFGAGRVLLLFVLLLMLLVLGGAGLLRLQPKKFDLWSCGEEKKTAAKAITNLG